jgi:signal transduction protein with GAF and PtsI domain
MENQKNQLSELEIFYEITRDINASLCQQAVLDSLLGHIVADLGYRAATLRLLDQEKQTLKLKAFHGLSEMYLSKGDVELKKSGIDRALISGQAVAIGDVRTESGFQYSKAAEQEGLTSMLAVPLTLHGRGIGVLHIYTAEPHEFGPDEKAFIEVIATLGAQAIRRTHCVEAFHRIAHQINSSLEVKQVLKILLVESVKELNVRAGLIRLLGPRKRTLHLAASYGLSDAYLEKGKIELAQSPVDRKVIQEACPVAISDIGSEIGFQYVDEAEREGIRSVLVLPLLRQEEAIGVMRLYSGQVRQFVPEEMSLADAVADLGAVAIENARLHEMLKDRLEALKEDSDGWYRFLSLS